MTHFWRLSLLWLLLALAPLESIRAADFFVYYTRIDSTEPFEQFARVGDHPDIVVKLGNPEGRLAFWRGASYLPYWETAQGRLYLPEIVARQGDGTSAMPDRVNLYSHAEIIENTASKIIIHWRYLSRFTPGNPHGNLDTNNFVDEVFTITPDARITRVIKQGTKTVDEWNDPLNQTVQTLSLTNDGIVELSRKEPARSIAPVPVKGNPQKASPSIPPALWFKFDEAQGDSVKETITGATVAVPGHKTLWKQGVSGTALEFDGYRTAVVLPAGNAPGIDGSLSLEGWLALGAYPWNWAPIVQQSDDEGYFLGVDNFGYPGFKVKIDGIWQELVVVSSPPYTDEKHLALFEWHHVAGTYDKSECIMRLYLNGREIAQKKVGTGGVQTARADVRIGKAGIMRTPTEGTHDTLPSDFGLDALIDEVRIYSSALSPEQVAESYRNGDPGPSIRGAPDMQKRALPKPTTDGQFKGIYTHLPYYETWENLWRFGSYPDVVVGFDRLPIKYVFWRGVSFIPMIVNESNQWFSNEFNETGGTDRAPGDCEPMSDKGCWDSHVRIIENTPARVVVHWRYRLANPDHHCANYNPATGWGDISDWYYYIYPDGVAAKCMRCYSDASDWHEWDEQMAILSEGQHPESVLRKTPIMTLVDDAGKAVAYDWNPEPPLPDYRGKIIQMIHFTGKFQPFTIQRFDAGDVYSGERTWYSVFPSWNHWPTSQIDSSGRNASFTDRAAHSSISHLYWPNSSRQGGDVPFEEKIMLEGMTDKSPESLVGLAKSWLQAAPIEPLADCRGAAYDPSQRAYVVGAAGSSPSFRIAASADRPTVNPCFVVNNWNCDQKARLQVESRPPLPAPNFRQGIVRDPNGCQSLVVWIESAFVAPAAFTLHGAEPGATLAGRPVEWLLPPRTDGDFSSIRMEATPTSVNGAEYRFECAEGAGHGTSWQRTPIFVDTQLPANTKLAYRFKIRDRYFGESDWSSVERITTDLAPPPVAWNMDGGSEATVKDRQEKHEGFFHGSVTWAPGVRGKSLHFDSQSYVEIPSAKDLNSAAGFTWAVWIRTERGGTILARAGAERQWQQGGKVLYLDKGRLYFDVGWVGCVDGPAAVADGKWHHVAVTVSRGGQRENVCCYADGRPVARGHLETDRFDESQLPVRIGFCNDDFPRNQSGFMGDIDEVHWVGYALDQQSIRKLYEHPTEK